MIMSKETLIKSIREIPDFPIPGILFYDVTTLFKDPWCLQELSDVMYEMYKDKGITKVVGIESRGFIMGPILATRLNAGFIPIRKPGKLPAETIEESYDKEYGKDTVQIHKDALDENDVVLLHDDLLATGGTMKAACELVKKLKPKKVYINFIIELKDLNGKSVFGDDVEVAIRIDFIKDLFIFAGRSDTTPFFILAISSLKIMNTEAENQTNEYLKGIVAKPS